MLLILQEVSYGVEYRDTWGEFRPFKHFGSNFEYIPIEIEASAQATAKLYLIPQIGFQISGFPLASELNLRVLPYLGADVTVIETIV